LFCISSFPVCFQLIYFMYSVRVMSKRDGREVVYEMVPKGEGIRFSIVASGWLLILLRFNDLKNWRPS
jgi:hypothetical protein